jgi:hypothetical protein
MQSPICNMSRTPHISMIWNSEVKLNIKYIFSIWNQWCGKRHTKFTMATIKSIFMKMFRRQSFKKININESTSLSNMAFSHTTLLLSVFIYEFGCLCRSSNYSEKERQTPKMHKRNRGFSFAIQSSSPKHATSPFPILESWHNKSSCFPATLHDMDKFNISQRFLLLSSHSL